jgi:hypothetical protein
MTQLTKKACAAHLVVIRISDSTAVKELDKKTRETAAMHLTLPGAKRLAALGAAPLGDPDSVGGRLINHPGMRAVVFRLPGTDTWVLMALGSATKANFGDDGNAFVTLLSDTLNERAVESIWVADFARLLRSIDYLSDTWKAIRHRCRFVRHAAAVIDTTGPTAEIQFLFEALSAAAERALRRPSNHSREDAQLPQRQVPDRSRGAPARLHPQRGPTGGPQSARR